jgi:hypothetical protein
MVVPLDLIIAQMLHERFLSHLTAGHFMVLSSKLGFFNGHHFEQQELFKFLFSDLLFLNNPTKSP